MVDPRPPHWVATSVGEGVVRDADAICEGCGTRGTVGVATRHKAGVRTDEHRYCADCWPEWSAFYQARWREQGRRASLAWRDRPRDDYTPPPPDWGMWFDSATWHGVIDVVNRLREAAHLHKDPPTAERLAQTAAEIRRFAPEKVGPMPLEVRAFLAEFGRAEGAP